MENNSHIRSHIALGVVILILAIILLALVFIPRPVHMIEQPVLVVAGRSVHH